MGEPACKRQQGYGGYSNPPATCGYAMANLWHPARPFPASRSRFCVSPRAPAPLSALLCDAPLPPAPSSVAPDVPLLPDSVDATPSPARQALPKRFQPGDDVPDFSTMDDEEYAEAIRYGMVPEVAEETGTSPIRMGWVPLDLPSSRTSSLAILPPRGPSARLTPPRKRAAPCSDDADRSRTYGYKTEGGIAEWDEDVWEPHQNGFDRRREAAQKAHEEEEWGWNRFGRAWRAGDGGVGARGGGGDRYLPDTNGLGPS
jgi:hypothetical protein